MNISDIVVVAIVGVFAFIGFQKGFLLSAFRLFSFFISAILSVKFYPMVAAFMLKTPLYASIKSSIFKNLMLRQQAAMPGLNSQAKEAAADSIISALRLPGFLKDSISKGLPNISSLVDVNSIVDAVSGQLARLVIDILSLVLLYVAIRIGLIFARVILKGISKLPIFKQMDKLGGMAFGGIEGLLTVYLVFAVLMLFNTSPQFKGFFDSLETSMFAKHFYSGNFIVDWMFKGGRII